jgi:Tfp pilus assembly protein PilO
VDKVKQWVALSLVGVVAVLAAGWFLLVAPKRSEASDLAGQAATAEASNAALRLKLAGLKADQKDLPAQQAELAAVAAKIPDNPALPLLIRALNKAADAAGVELISLSPSNPTAVGPATSTSTTPVAAPVAKGSAASETTPVVPKAVPAGPPPMSSIAVTLNVVGGYYQIETFLDSVEQLTRAMKVTTLSVVPGSNPLKVVAPTGGAMAAAPSVDDGRVLSATITGNVYMAPAQPGVIAPAK